MNPRRVRLRRFLVTGLCLAVLACLGACSSADDALRVLGRNAGKLDDVAGDVPRNRLPEPVSVPRQQVQSEIDRIMARVAEQGEEAKPVTYTACIAKDAIGVQSLDDAVDFAIQQTNTPAAYHGTVRDLAADLAAAESSGQQASVLAVAAICQWAG